MSENSADNTETTTDESTAQTDRVAELVAQLEEATKKLDEWKGHSRTWEDRAKASKAAADEATEKLAGLEDGARRLTEAETELAASRLEVAMWRELTRRGVDAARMMDSRSFMSAMSGADPTDEAFGDQVTEAVSAVPTVTNLSGETPAETAGRGKALFERIHGQK